MRSESQVTLGLQSHRLYFPSFTFMCENGSCFWREKNVTTTFYELWMTAGNWFCYSSKYHQCGRKSCFCLILLVNVGGERTKVTQILSTQCAHTHTHMSTIKYSMQANGEDKFWNAFALEIWLNFRWWNGCWRTHSEYVAQILEMVGNCSIWCAMCTYVFLVEEEACMMVCVRVYTRHTLQSQSHHKCIVIVPEAKIKYVRREFHWCSAFSSADEPAEMNEWFDLQQRVHFVDHHTLYIHNPTQRIKIYIQWMALQPNLYNPTQCDGMFDESILIKYVIIKPSSERANERGNICLNYCCHKSKFWIQRSALIIAFAFCVFVIHTVRFCARLCVWARAHCTHIPYSELERQNGIKIIEVLRVG